MMAMAAAVAELAAGGDVMGESRDDRPRPSDDPLRRSGVGWSAPASAAMAAVMSSCRGGVVPAAPPA